MRPYAPATTREHAARATRTCAYYKHLRASCQLIFADYAVFLRQNAAIFGENAGSGEISLIEI